MNSSLELHKKEERLMKKFIALLLTLLLRWQRNRHIAPCTAAK